MNNFNELFEYRDGSIFWKKSGLKAGCIDGSTGYVKVKCGGKMYYAHRIIWMMHKGQTNTTIDHINGNPSDNRLENLREASKSQNQSNQKKSSKNTTGHKNVFFVPKLNRWRVRVQIDGKRTDFGYHDSVEAAVIASEQARNQIHKEFARHA